MTDPYRTGLFLVVMLCAGALVAEGQEYDFDNLSGGSPGAGTTIELSGARSESEGALNRQNRQFLEEETKEKSKYFDLRNACLASFEGKSLCYSIRDKDQQYACFAGFEGKSPCYSIRDKDQQYACFAGFEGKSPCYSIRDKDQQYACLARFEGKSLCYSIRDKDQQYDCLARFEGKSLCYSIKK